MSWQNYVDKQLIGSRCIAEAAIAGRDGMVWAKSDNFGVTKEELAKLIDNFNNQDLLKSGGVTLAGRQYIFTSGNDREVRAKYEEVGVHCMKTKQTVIVGLYKAPTQPERAISIMEKFSNYLTSRGY